MIAEARNELIEYLEAVDVRLEVEEKKETEAQSCFDRI